MEEKNWLGTDLALDETQLGADLSSSSRGDIDQISDEMNLAQAILHRLRTIRGELADIGHPNYGSDLYDLIGEPNNQSTRDRVKNLVRATIRDEPRVKEIVKVEVRSRLELLDKKRGGQYPRQAQTLHEAKTGAEGNGQIHGGKSSSYEEDRRALATSVDVDITIIPINSNVPLNIVFPFYLEVS